MSAPLGFRPSDRVPTPPEPVRVEALLPTWCCNGATVVVGRKYLVDPSAAAQLVAVGKAKLA